MVPSSAVSSPSPAFRSCSKRASEDKSWLMACSRSRSATICRTSSKTSFFFSSMVRKCFLQLFGRGDSFTFSLNMTFLASNSGPLLAFRISSMTVFMILASPSWQASTADCRSFSTCSNACSEPAEFAPVPVQLLNTLVASAQAAVTLAIRSSTMEDASPVMVSAASFSSACCRFFFSASSCRSCLFLASATLFFTSLWATCARVPRTLRFWSCSFKSCSAAAPRVLRSSSCFCLR
mmetsp:Transcript_38029/g.89250  ORF Transcript_38029/g.89250 Transcript_38029/m.89250 type:complete len:236 (-) Transcript_38029:159-866(-)